MSDCWWGENPTGSRLSWDLGVWLPTWQTFSSSNVPEMGVDQRALVSQKRKKVSEEVNTDRYLTRWLTRVVTRKTEWRHQSSRSAGCHLPAPILWIKPQSTSKMTKV
jgi:hypothetical protein